VKLDWSKIAGLAETLGKNGVCSNYSPEHVTYTWDCLQRLKSGSRAVFTQPPLPFKCPGAPQKIVYLTADHLQHQGILKDCSLNYYVHAPVIFGVPFFARELVKIAAVTVSAKSADAEPGALESPTGIAFSFAPLIVRLRLSSESRARKSRALNSSLLGTRYAVGTLDDVGAIAYLGGGAHV